MRRITSLLLGMLLGIAAAGCLEADGSTPDSAESEEASNEQEKTDSTPHYSSFGVSLRQGERFDLISFKDVGLGRENPSPTGPLLETVAQSLSYEMRVNGDLQLRPRVFVDEDLADPSEHTYCEANRLYIDLWRSEQPSKWGYSLWSGCSESQQFAWEEVPVPESTDEMTERVEPLTEEIVHSIAVADQKDCFQRAC